VSGDGGGRSDPGDDGDFAGGWEGFEGRVYIGRRHRRRRRCIEVHQTEKYRRLAHRRRQFPCVFGIADLHSPDEIIYT